MPPSSRNPKPHNAHLSEKTGRYYFLTDHDILYVCAFNNLTPSIPHMVGIYNIEISDFQFSPQRMEKHHDPRVSATVVGLLKGYFTDESRVLVYLCDASDGRPQVRQALFSRWHRNTWRI